MSEEYAVPATGALVLNEDDEIFLMKSPKWDGKWLAQSTPQELICS